MSMDVERPFYQTALQRKAIGWTNLTDYSGVNPDWDGLVGVDLVAPVYHPGSTFFGVSAATYTLDGISDYLSQLPTKEGLEVGTGGMRVCIQIC